MKFSGPSHGFRSMMLFIGFFFLYAPILSLIMYSFNSSELVTVWAGFSLHWYGELFRDQLMIDAALMSLRIAFYTACAAVVLGTLAALVMTRFRSFRGKTLFSGLITAPLVMPEVILGISILMMIVTMGDFIGFPIERGVVTVWIAHVTFTVSFVTVVISSRMSELDRSLEEAAMDLGANRVKVFFLITLPIIAPSLVAGFLLAFTLSLDDVVLASFVNGPGSTTLPQIVLSSMRRGLSPKINALATILVSIVALGAFIGWWFTARAEKRRLRDMQLALQKGD
jgi:putrescine transport system permease protein